MSSLSQQVLDALSRTAPRSMNAKADSEIDVKVDDPDFAAALREKLRKSPAAADLVPHDVAREETISRITAAEISAIVTATAPPAPPPAPSGGGIGGWFVEKGRKVEQTFNELKSASQTKIASLLVGTPAECRDNLVDDARRCSSRSMAIGSRRSRQRRGRGSTRSFPGKPSGATRAVCTGWAPA